MKYDRILYTQRESVGFLTLNHPRKVNALSGRMIGEITDALGEAAADPSLKVLVIRGEGNHFCAGHDLNELLGRGTKAYMDLFEACSRMMRLLHEMPQPVIAQVQGIATAAGCQLVAWCDLAIAEEGARFATPGVKIGLFCTTPSVAVSRALGRKAAMEMLLTGRYVSAREAKELGLINRVVPLESLGRETEDLARQIAEASRVSLASGKKSFYRQLDLPEESALAFATQTMAMSLGTEDAQSGIRAFLEKTPPRWEDR